MTEAGSKAQIPRGADLSAPCFGSVLGTLPLPMAWGRQARAGSTSMAWSICLLLRQGKPRGTARVCKESVICEPDVPWCPKLAGTTESMRSTLGVWQNSGVCSWLRDASGLGGVQAERDPAPEGLGTQRCFWGTLPVGSAGWRAKDSDHWRRYTKAKAEGRCLLARWKKYKWVEGRINFQLAKSKR